METFILKGINLFVFSLGISREDKNNVWGSGTAHPIVINADRSSVLQINAIHDVARNEGVIHLWIWKRKFFRDITYRKCYCCIIWVCYHRRQGFFTQVNNFMHWRPPWGQDISWKWTEMCLPLSNPHRRCSDPAEDFPRTGTGLIFSSRLHQRVKTFDSHNVQ
jgi:hypothetical protein